MADDERRAEIEAGVAAIIGRYARTGELRAAREVLAYLDRVRDARHDDEAAELEVLRDLRARVIGFGGDDYALAPWVDAHRQHKDEPYIGCPFCRDQFVSRADLDGEWSDEMARLANEARMLNAEIDRLREALRDARGDERCDCGYVGEGCNPRACHQRQWPGPSGP